MIIRAIVTNVLAPSDYVGIVTISAKNEEEAWDKCEEWMHNMDAIILLNPSQWKKLKELLK